VSVTNIDELGIHDHGSAATSAAEHSASGIILKVANTLIPTASVLTLTTPVTVVAAPGAGRVNIFKGAILFLDYNSIAYTLETDDDLQFKYTNASGAAASVALEARGFLDQTNDEYIYAPIVSPALIDVSTLANAAIVLDATGANPGAGNSPLKVRVFYEQWDTTSLASIA